jgi:hypothetical protein
MIHAYKIIDTKDALGRYIHEFCTWVIENVEIISSSVHYDLLDDTFLTL